MSTFIPITDPNSADWWLRQLRRDDSIGKWVPDTMESVCAVLHPFTNSHGNWAAWADLQREWGPSFRDLARSAAGVPAAETEHLPNYILDGILSAAAAGEEPVGRLRCAVWVGGRLHHLIKGLDSPAHLYLNDFEFALVQWKKGRSVDDDGWESPAEGIIWPLSQAWILVTLPDLTWSFFAGSRAVVARVMASEDLESLPLDFDDKYSSLPSQPSER